MTPEERQRQCDGSCEDYSNGHSGPVRRVHVWGHGASKEDPWEFYYCDIAIAEDRKRGFTVEEVASE